MQVRTDAPVRGLQRNTSKSKQEEDRTKPVQILSSAKAVVSKQLHKAYYQNLEGSAEGTRHSKPESRRSPLNATPDQPRLVSLLETQVNSTQNATALPD